jgi:ligand-binding sensor domain-containing protein
MKKLPKVHLLKYAIGIFVIIGIVSTGFVLIKKSGIVHKSRNTDKDAVTVRTQDQVIEIPSSGSVIKEAKAMPVYGHWRNFTTKDGLLNDHVYTVRIVGDSVLAGTHDGLAVYSKGRWHTYTTKDGLAHNGVVSIDYSKTTGDVWIGTLGGLNRWSGGKFETFNQFNSGMPNDLVYSVYCDGKDIWVATGGGAGHYDTFSKQWDIFTEQNAPMHEPWTYGVSTGNGKAYIAAWGGGVIEYNLKTRKFRDYTDPDGFMEIDLQPDDGVIHDITTATTYSDSILWVSTYFGLSRYDGKNWKGYFDMNSGLASNFINFVRAVGPVVFICCDNGLSSTDGKSWVTYKKNDNNSDGKAIIKNFGRKDENNTDTLTTELPLSPSIAHNFIIGVDADENYLWVATEKGVSCGERLR